MKNLNLTYKETEQCSGLETGFSFCGTYNSKFGAEYLREIETIDIHGSKGRVRGPKGGLVDLFTRFFLSISKF